jgi:hypothetical protein
MHWIRVALTAAGWAALLAWPSAGSAQILGTAGGSVDLSWDRCAPIVTDKEMTPGPLVLYASLTGHAIPHQAYQFWFLVAPCWPSNVLPDAWRFDAAGCQGSSRVSIEHVAPPEVAASCPSFQGDLESIQIQTFQLSPPALGYPTTWGNGVLQNAYPAGNTTQVDPAQRYFLGRFVFDHSQSTFGPTVPGDGCGGLEKMLLIYLVPGKVSWLDLAGSEFEFSPGNRSIGVNGGYPWCWPDPVQPATWGSIKAQYR